MKPSTPNGFPILMGDTHDLVFVMNRHNLWTMHMKDGSDDPIVVDWEMRLDLVAQVV